MIAHDVASKHDPCACVFDFASRVYSSQNKKTKTQDSAVCKLVNSNTVSNTLLTLLLLAMYFASKWGGRKGWFTSKLLANSLWCEVVNRG